jgi:hypothetical protein
VVQKNNLSIAKFYESKTYTQDDINGHRVLMGLNNDLKKELETFYGFFSSSSTSFNNPLVVDNNIISHSDSASSTTTPKSSTIDLATPKAQTIDLTTPKAQTISLPISNTSVVNIETVVNTSVDNISKYPPIPKTNEGFPQNEENLDAIPVRLK